MERLFNFFRFLHNFKLVEELNNKIYLTHGTLDMLKRQHQRELEAKDAACKEQCSYLQSVIAKYEEMTTDTSVQLDLDKLTLENTVGITLVKSKTKGDRYKSRLNILDSKGKTQSFHIGTFDTIQEAYLARMDFIDNLK